jgi:surface carbohydrate biosynthesis protein (TIGR04326 family)
MRVLDIYENIPKTYNKNNISLIWNNQIQNSNVNFFSIFDLINLNPIITKFELNNYLKKFILKNRNFFFSHFNLKKDFSFLILSNFVEKNPYKKNFNLELIKKLSVQLFIKKKKFDKIIIYSQNDHFIDKINIIIKKKKIKIDYFCIIKNYIQLIIIYFKNLIRLFFFVKNINFIKKEKIQINKNPIFFSFFSYTNKDLALKRIYSSEYWKGFKNTKNKNWVHLFDPSPTYTQSKEVGKIIKNLNNSTVNPNHFFLDDYLDFKMYLKTLFIFTKFFFLTSKLFFSIKFLKILKREFLLTNQNYFIFFEELISFNSIRNILFFYQFEKFFLVNKIKSKIFYCFENQPWEKIILYFIKKNYPTVKTHGVIHSAVRFWDFRFINFSNKNIKKIGYYNPDKILCNSYFVKKILVDNGFNKKNLLEVEALRYLNLKKIKIKKKILRKAKTNILFFSDYDNNLNKHIIGLVNRYNSNKNYSLFLKCHPLAPINIYQKNLKKIDHIEEVKNKIDICIVGNKTAVSLDLFYKNLRFLIFVEKNDLDYSPLYKFIKYNTISCAEDLDDILNSKNKLNYTWYSKKYFITGKDLTRWNKILS